VSILDFPGGRSEVAVEHGQNGAGEGPHQGVGSACTTGSGTDQCTTNSFDDRKWSSLPVSYSVNLRDSGDDGNFLAAIEAAAQTWEDDAGSAFDATFNGTTGRKASSLKNRMDGNNDVTFQPLDRFQNPIAVTIYWYFTATGEIVEFDLINNSTFDWSSNIGFAGDPDSATGDPNKFDLQDIETHEFGHAFAGLRDLTHSSESLLTMYGFGTEGELLKRTLGFGDRLSIAAAYPEPVTGSTGSIAGTVVDSNGAISGASVVVVGTQLTDVTDDNGNYSIANVPVGVLYDVTASASGFESATATAVAVSEGVETTVDFTLTPATTPPPPSSLTVTVDATPSSIQRGETVIIDGLVTDDINTVAGATVTLIIDSPRGPNLTPTVPPVTNADGVYSFSFTPQNRNGTGMFSVTATAEKDGVQSNTAEATFEVTP
jgi:hypothetical protein